MNNASNTIDPLNVIGRGSDVVILIEVELPVTRHRAVGGITVEGLVELGLIEEHRLVLLFLLLCALVVYGDMPGEYVPRLVRCAVQVLPHFAVPRQVFVVVYVYRLVGQHVNAFLGQGWRL